MDAFIKEEYDNRDEPSSSASRKAESDSNDDDDDAPMKDEVKSEHLTVDDDDDEDTKDAEDEEMEPMSPKSPKLVVDEENVCADTSVSVS